MYVRLTIPELSAPALLTDLGVLPAYEDAAADNADDVAVTDCGSDEVSLHLVKGSNVLASNTLRVPRAVHTTA